MEKTEEITAEIPATIAGVTFIPIVKVTSRCWHRKKAVSFYGIKQPLGVIVISPLFKKGFDISGEEVGMEHFMQVAPGLKTVLEKYR